MLSERVSDLLFWPATLRSEQLRPGTHGPLVARFCSTTESQGRISHEYGEAAQPRCGQYISEILPHDPVVLQNRGTKSPVCSRCKGESVPQHTWREPGFLVRRPWTLSDILVTNLCLTRAHAPSLSLSYILVAYVLAYAILRPHRSFRDHENLFII